MSRIATARKLANEIWFNTEAMTDRAAWEAFTIAQSIGYPLAHAIVKGWVTGISTEGVTQLRETVRDLRNLLALAALPQADVTSEPTGVLPVTIDSDGTHYVLYSLVDGGPDARPVLVGEILTDEDGDTFKVTGVEIGASTGSLYLAGHWVAVTDQEVTGRTISRGVGGFPGVGWAAENDQAKIAAAAELRAAYARHAECGNCMNVPTHRIQFKAGGAVRTCMVHNTAEAWPVGSVDYVEQLPANERY